MVRVIPYVRQSEARPGEDADESISLNGQLRAITDRGKREGWVVLPEIRDHDVRGADPNRPGIREMWRRIDEEKPDVIAVFAMSRFARDNVVQELTWRQLREHGVGVVSIHEPNIDHTLMRGLLGVVNQYRTEEISQFLTASFERRASTGLYHGEAPFGYRKHSSEGIQKPVLSCHPDEAPVVQRVYALCIQGVRHAQIAEILNREGVPPRRAAFWSGNMIRQILRHPVYTGDVRYKGQIVATDAHPALIDRPTWECVQTLLDERVVVRTKAWSIASPLEGLVVHACGERMYLSESNGPRSKQPSVGFTCKTAYLPREQRCPIPRRSIAVSKLETAARAALASDLQQLLSLDEAIARATSLAAADGIGKERTRLDHQRNVLVARRERIEQLYSTGRRGLAWFDTEDAAIQSQLLDVDRSLAALPQAPDPHRFQVARDLLLSWADILPAAPIANLAKAIAELGRVMVDADAVWIDYLPPYDGLLPDPERILVGRWAS